MKIDFLKIDEDLLVSYYHFTQMINGFNLLELNGYRVRNILSIVFTNEIKSYILNDLFGKDGKVLSNETKSDLFNNVSDEERDDLKNVLNDYLNFQINSNWLQSIIKTIQVHQLNNLIMPSFIVNNSFLSNELKRLFPNKKIIDWSSFDISKKALFIDYNHSWNKKNIFNVDNNESRGFFLGHFFENVYRWKIFNDEENFYRLFVGSTREQLYGSKILDEIKQKLRLIKPESKKKEDYKFYEIEHKNSFYAQDELVIFFSNGKQNRYPMSSSFLLKKGFKYVIVNAWELVNNPKDYECVYKACNVESLISKIDLSNLKVEIEKQNNKNSAVEQLWKTYDLNPDNGKLWKQLLKLKVNEFGIDYTYSVIKSKANNSTFVSKNTFEQTYCNPHNPTITPREKKIFRIICRYLDLPIEYMLALQRERNLTGESSQEKNYNLKKWLKVIVEFDLLNLSESNIFNNSSSAHFQLLKDKIDFEYFGLTEDTLSIAFKEFVDEILLKMNCNTIEKIEYVILN